VTPSLDSAKLKIDRAGEHREAVEEAVDVWLRTGAYAISRDIDPQTGASKGLTARQIADAMGHKKTATTEVYIQRFNGEQADERVREAMTG
jgi:hypothetical protein